MTTDERPEPQGEDAPSDHLAVRRPAPDWFRAAIASPKQSRRVSVADCPIHYLLWPGEAVTNDRRGLMFVHGGGAHANWWSFIAPFFVGRFTVAALDLSGMGDSGRRAAYSADLRAEEIRAVIADAGLGARPFVVGHSFGGFMTMRFAARYGDGLGGAVIVDTPVRPPGQEVGRGPPRASRQRFYDSFEAGVERFRLLPPQPCENEYIVEFIARHSLARAESGWTWKFDPEALGIQRFAEPFGDDLRAMRCRRALMVGARSAIVTAETAAYMSSLLGPQAPVIEIPEARHHVMLDQPLAFAAALRALLEAWMRAEA